MSLQFVTKKLEGHTLDEALNKIKDKLEDSGSESDDETEPEIVTTEKDITLKGGQKEPTTVVGTAGSTENRKIPAVYVGCEKLDTGVSLCPNTANVTDSNLTLEKERPIQATASSMMAVNTNLATAIYEDNDHHSSEEELEDIIGGDHRRKVYVDGGCSSLAGTNFKSAGGTSSSISAAGGGGVSALRSNATSTSATTTAGRASAVEKRKWSEVEQKEQTGPAGSASRTGSGSSGDEEVSGYMGCSYTPVQFCTSPPLSVYKPRRSQSPPPKLFHLSSNGVEDHHGSQDPPNIHSLRESQMLSGAFRPRVRGSGLSAAVVGRGFTDQDDDHKEEDLSPSKKHRTTPRPHTIQRPCLDFEKMQQIKTKVVTSWRQGTELSLFCW